ncbi:MAG: hypothetical protein OEW91_10285 [Acidimicrobiia bacterium]|nr:hypothetical protein [Acidimicrobiia bacterium]
MVSIQVFGPVRIIGSGGQIELSGQALEIMAYLATRWDHGATVGELLDAFWPASGDGATEATRPEGALHTAISRLRSRLTTAVGHGIVIRNGARYELDPSTGLDIDCARVRTSIRGSHEPPLSGADWESAGQLLLARPPGPTLAGVTGEWAPPTRVRLEKDFRSAVLAWASAGLALGHPAAVADGIASMMNRDVLSDDLGIREFLARANLQAGRVSKARRTVSELRAVAARQDVALTTDQQELEDEIFRREAQAMAPAGPLVCRQAPRDMSSFIGRRVELADIELLLRDHRLVTLIGPGGVGKTRLAIEATYRQARTCAVAWVPLADVEQSGVWAELSRSLGLLSEDREAILDYLRSWKGMVVLDNCEHVSVSELAASIGERCPEVVLLVTSRIRLGVRHERVYPVAPLRFVESRDPDEVLASDAAGLFIDRVRSRGTPVVFDAASAQLVSTICRSLDGLPLALELAAAKVTESDGLRALAAQLARGEPVDLSAADDWRHKRHRSLVETLEWSLQLLDPIDRALFPSVSVFRGPIDAAAMASILDVHIDPMVHQRRPAALAVTAKAPGSLYVTEERHGTASLTLAGHRESDVARTVADHVAQRFLTNLSAASLLAPESGGYRALETVRQHARAALTTEMEADLRERHAMHFAQRAGESGRRLFADPSAVVEISRDLPNYRQALATSIQAPYAPLAVNLVGRLAFFWLWSGRPVEGMQWAQAALEMARDQIVQLLDERTAASWMGGLELTVGFLASVAGRLDTAERHLSAAISTFSENSYLMDDGQARTDRRMMAWSLFHLARTLTTRSFSGETDVDLLESAAAGYNMAIEIFRSGGRKTDEAYVLPFAAWNAWQLGDDGEPLVERALDLARPAMPGQTGLPWVEAVASVNHLLLRLARNPHAGLADEFARHATYLRSVGDLYSLLITVDLLGFAAVSEQTLPIARDAALEALDIIQAHETREWDALTFGLVASVLSLEESEHVGVVCSWLDAHCPGWVELVHRLHGPADALRSADRVRHPLGAGPAEMARLLSPILREMERIDA